MQLGSSIYRSAMEETRVLQTYSFGQVLDMILRQYEVSQLRQTGNLLRQLFQLVLRDVELGQFL